jgi:phosphate transport system substrate-binding protein
MKPCKTFAVLALIGLSFGASAQTIRGGGSTFSTNLYAAWAKASGNMMLNYGGGGSEKGVEELLAGRLDFAGTDRPMTATDLRRNLMHQVPVAATGVVMAVNLPGMTAPVRLTGQNLAGIYLGQITKWSDPALVQANPALAAVNLPIQVLARGDGSGTTFVFTKYLSSVSGAWASNMGTRMRHNWAVGQQEKGSGALAAAVKRTPGAIGYVDYPTALREQLQITELQNRNGRFVRPTPESFNAAIEKINWAQAFVGTMPVFDIDILDVAGDAAWPITTFTFAVFPASGNDSKKIASTRDVFRRGLSMPQVTSAAGYIPVPEEVSRKVIQSLEGR